MEFIFTHQSFKISLFPTSREPTLKTYEDDTKMLIIEIFPHLEAGLALP